MTRAFELLKIQVDIRGASCTSSKLSFELSEEADSALTPILAPHGRYADEFIYKLSVSFQDGQYWPWAIVCFEREFRLAGHILSTRDTPRDVTLTAYSIGPGHRVETHGVPPVSALMFASKEGASRLSVRSPLFDACWECLRDLDDQRHWICIGKAPPEEWLLQVEPNDSALFLEKLQARQQLGRRQ